MTETTEERVRRTASEFGLRLVKHPAEYTLVDWETGRPAVEGSATLDQIERYVEQLEARFAAHAKGSSTG